MIDPEHLETGAVNEAYQQGGIDGGEDFGCLAPIIIFVVVVGLLVLWIKFC